MRQRRLAIGPVLLHRLHDAPARHHAVGALKQGGVADHAVVNQGLIPGARCVLEVILVVEVHVHLADGNLGAGDFCAEGEHRAFVGLQLDDQRIGRELVGSRIAKQRQRRALELDHDFALALGHGLACAQVKGHTGPAPVVHAELERHIGFGAAAAGHAVFAGIGLERFAVARARGVLAAHAVGGRVHRVHRIQHFGFFVAHRVRVKRGGRLHSGKRQQLEHVVRHHVAHGPGGFIKRGARFHTHGLCHGDLHMVDVVAVPQRLKNSIGKTHEHDVLHGFLAQEMVHAVDLRLRQAVAQLGVERLRRGQVVAKGFFHHHAAPVIRRLSHQSGGTELVGDRAKKPRTHRQVKHHAVAHPMAALELCQPRAQRLVGRWRGEVGLHVDDAGEQALQAGLVNRLAVVLVGGEGAYGGFHMVAVLRVGLLNPVQAHQRELRGQQAGARQVVERGHEQALGQVTTGTKDDHGGGGRLVAVRRGGVFDVLGHVVSFGLWGGGISGRGLLLAAFLVSAELLAHGRQQFLGERVVLAGPEAGVQRGGQHIGRNRFFNRCLNRPAAFA